MGSSQSGIPRVMVSGGGAVKPSDDASTKGVAIGAGFTRTYSICEAIEAKGIDSTYPSLKYGLALRLLPFK